MNKFKTRLLLLIAVIIAIIPALEKRKVDLESARVTRIVDGDTVVVDGNRKIRIIGINTPEVGRNEEPLGKEAKDFATDKLLNKRVWLEKDKSDIDRYKRELRYIWLKRPRKTNLSYISNLNYSGIILEKGLARMYTFKPDVKYRREFEKIQRAAIKKKKGMWAYNREITRGNDIR